MYKNKYLKYKKKYLDLKNLKGGGLFAMNPLLSTDDYAIKLREAIKNNDLDEVKRIIDSYNEIGYEHHNSTLNGMDSPLTFAIKQVSDTYEIVEFLLETNQVNINLVDNMGRTPLCIAVTYDKINIVELLLNKGADVNLPDRAKVTPLSIAVKNNNIDMIKLLLDKGAYIDLRNDDRDLRNVPNEQKREKQTPLEIAIEINNQDIVNQLVNSGNYLSK